MAPLRLNTPPFLTDVLHLSAGALMTYALYGLFAFWLFHTLVAVYHWLRYSHTSWLAFPAIGLHLAISFSLLSYLLSGNGILLAPFLP